MRGRRDHDKPPPIRLLPPCTVCCQTAAGFHYGVTTCEACKGFFRRSLLRTKPYGCVQTKQCRIGAGTARRHMCPKCRYDKCISVGMSKDAIKTGRYSLLKKSKDICALLQYQQSSANGSLDEGLRKKATQTLEKINRTKYREWSKYCGDVTLSIFVSSSKGETSLNTSPRKDLSSKVPDKITKFVPSNEITHVGNNGDRASVQHESFPNPQTNPTTMAGADDIKHYKTSKKSTLPFHGLRQNHSHSPTHYRDGWNHTLPATVNANSNLNPSGYPYSPITCQCDHRFASFCHSHSTVDHPHSCSHVTDVPFSTWSGNHCIHSKEYLGTERDTDPRCNISTGSMQKREYSARSHGTWFYEMKNDRSSLSPTYSSRREQDDSPHPWKPWDRSLYPENGQNSSCPVSEPIKDCLPMQTGSILQPAQSFWNRCQRGTSQLAEQKWRNIQNSDNYTHRFSYPCQAETYSENSEMPEVAFQKRIAHSITGMDTWGHYGCYNDNERDDNGVDAGYIDKRNNDKSSVCNFGNRGLHPGYDVMSCKQIRDDESGFKSPVRGLEEKRSINNSDYSQPHQTTRSTEISAALESGKSDDTQRFSNFDIPKSIAITDMFDLTFIERFPYLSYEKNLLKSILENYSDSVSLKRGTDPNRESITRAIRSTWQREISNAIETSTPTENFLSQWNTECNPCPALSTTSAFTAENLYGFNFNDYDSTDLEDLISGLIKSHETIIGPDSNCLSEREIRTAHNVFQGLCRLKEELLGQFQRIDTTHSWKPSNTEGDGRRDMLCVYSLRSNENLPKVINFYRSIPGFMQLSYKDRITLVRGAIGEFMFLSSFRGLDHKRLTLVDAINLMTIDMSTLVFAFPIFRELCTTMQLIGQELNHLKLSKDTLIVLKAISLMTPDRPCLEKPEQVKVIYKRLHACLKLLLDKQHSECGLVVYDKIGALFHTMQLSVEKFMHQRDDNLKKVLEETPVPLLKETLFHFLFK